jgi:hypothetical protein
MGGARYDVVRDRRGWAVYDTATGKSVRVDGVLQNDLPLDLARELADLLNKLREAHEGTRH